MFGKKCINIRVLNSLASLWEAYSSHQWPTKSDIVLQKTRIRFHMQYR